MSPDNECGHYCNVEDGHYYTIGITNRQMAPHNILAYIVQLHNGIYSDTAVEYLNRAIHSMNRDRPIMLVGHQFAGNSLARFNATIRDLKVCDESSFYVKAMYSLGLQEILSNWK